MVTNELSLTGLNRCRNLITSLLCSPFDIARDSSQEPSKDLTCKNAEHLQFPLLPNVAVKARRV